MAGDDFDVGESSTVEVGAEERRDLLGREIGHQPEVDLRARHGGQDGLRARAGVARNDPADRAGWLVKMLLLERGTGEAPNEALDPVDAQHGLLVERQAL